MASISSSVPLRAGLILPQDISLFVKWQKEHDPDAEIGHVSDALQYFRFIKYRNALINGGLQVQAATEPHTASECGHAYHPSDRLINELCPICEVQAHLSLLLAIANAWNKIGGPRLRPGTHVKRTSYATLRSAWHTARCHLQELVDMFSVSVFYEEEWERKHPLQAAAARSTYCASAAIRYAQADTRYPALLVPRAVGTSAKNTSTEGQKRVTFSPEVRIKKEENTSTSAMKFIPGRSRAQFSRFSSAYQPGMHACAEDFEYIDTSQGDSLFASIRSLKIYATNDEDAFDKLQADPYFYSDFVGNHEGIVGLHKLNDDIIQTLSNLMEQDATQKEVIQDLVEGADRIAVLINEKTGGVVDVFLLDGDIDREDDEDTPDKKTIRGRSSDWTCLRESLQ